MPSYAPFIRSPDVPKSIYEIPGSRTCAIEVNSLSKYAGFTGVRLGWTVVPKELKFADGTSVAADFNRIMCTVFNGASRVVQVRVLLRTRAAARRLTCPPRASRARARSSSPAALS